MAVAAASVTNSPNNSRRLVTRFLSRAAINLQDGPCESGLSNNFTHFEATFPIRKRSPLFAEEVTKQFPALNILINNAGIMREINIHDKAGSLEDLTREIEINLSGPIRMVKQFLPHLKTKSEAAIVNVSSGLAFVPLPISPVYCATKAGLHSFTESLRVQLKNTKVKVFDFKAPPATQTELLGTLYF